MLEFVSLCSVSSCTQFLPSACNNCEFFTSIFLSNNFEWKYFFQIKYGFAKAITNQI